MGKRVSAPDVRVKSSSFHITMNTNQRYTNKESLRLDLKPIWDALHNTYGTKESVGEIVEILNPLDTFDGSVGSVSSDSGIEYAASGLHTHTLLTILHTTKLRINLKALRAILDKNLPHLTSYYLNVRYVPNQVQTVKNYIYKEVGEKRYKMTEGMEWNGTGEVMTCKCERKIASMSSFFS
jgi:hypothetical protein